MIAYKDGIVYIPGNIGASPRKIIFHASHKLFQNLGLLETISRYKERSLGLRSALLVKGDGQKIFEVLVSKIDDTFLVMVEKYLQQINTFNKIYNDLTGANQQVCFSQRGESSEIGSEITTIQLQKSLLEGDLHVDRYDLSLIDILGPQIIQASEHVNNKAFVDDIFMNDFTQMGIHCPQQKVINESLCLEQLLLTVDDSKEYFIKIDVGAFGSQVCKLSSTCEAERLIQQHNTRLVSGRESSILLCEEIESSTDKEFYISPCIIGRIVGGKTYVEQVSDQIFSESGEYIGSRWLKDNEDKFYKKFSKQKLHDMMQLIYQKTGYEGYIGLDFILSNTGYYAFVGDINARMNGSDDMFLTRKLLEDKVGIESCIMCDLTVQNIDKLEKFAFNGERGLIILPDIAKDIGIGFRCVGVFINTEVDEELYSSFLHLI